MLSDSLRKSLMGSFSEWLRLRRMLALSVKQVVWDYFFNMSGLNSRLLANRRSKRINMQVELETSKKITIFSYLSALTIQTLSNYSFCAAGEINEIVNLHQTNIRDLLLRVWWNSTKYLMHNVEKVRFRWDLLSLAIFLFIYNCGISSGLLFFWNSREEKWFMTRRSSIDDHYATQHTNDFTFLSTPAPASNIKKIFFWKLLWMP